jgi:hypothetical protein
MMGGIGTGQATPWVGAMERINIGAFLFWVMVLATSLFRVRDTEAGARMVPASTCRRERYPPGERRPSCTALRTTSVP